MKDFKIRCSAIGEIMGGLKTALLTDKQKERLAELRGKEKLTEKQTEEFGKLISKRDSKPELTKGGVSYCQKWLNQQIYGHYEFWSKETEKGKLVELDAIKYLDPSFERYWGDMFEDDYFTGTPDVIHEDRIIDIKAPWTHDTFPRFDETIPDLNYMYQVQGYMHLTGIKKGTVAYVLMNTPKELDRKALDYDFVPRKHRIKEFHFEYNPSLIDTIKMRVDLCREYISGLDL
jgi:hypothetical protein